MAAKLEYDGGNQPIKDEINCYNSRFFNLFEKKDKNKQSMLQKKPELAINSVAAALESVMKKINLIRVEEPEAYDKLVRLVNANAKLINTLMDKHRLEGDRIPPIPEREENAKEPPKFSNFSKTPGEKKRSAYSDAPISYKSQALFVTGGALFAGGAWLTWTGINGIASGVGAAWAAKEAADKAAKAGAKALLCEATKKTAEEMSKAAMKAGAIEVAEIAANQAVAAAAKEMAKKATQKAAEETAKKMASLATEKFVIGTANVALGSASASVGNQAMFGGSSNKGKEKEDKNTNTKPNSPRG